MERSQARSMVITRSGLVAASQTLASQAGAQALARGGSAVDAAIVANAVLSVVEPMMCGLGGDLFAIHRDASGALTGINASGYAPRALTLERLNFSVPLSGIHTVTVPGAVDGWSKLHARFGKLPWADLFAPAIYCADHGFPLTEIIQYDWEHCDRVLEDENGARLFLPGGRAPRVGEIFRNPDLARAYRILAECGPRALYEGELARAILATSRRLGGTISAADLRDFESEWVAPLSSSYRGWAVFELPPNGQGVGTLQMLNIMENFPLLAMDPLGADAIHIKIEAQKRAFADQRRYIADPRFSDVPLDRLLSKDYARAQAASIGHTVYLAAADREGNLVSWIQSISDLWGSGVLVDGFGFHLHSRGAAFSSDPAHPNALEPGKRPYHTIIPGFMESDQQHIAFGIMRGLNQAQAQAQFVSSIADHGMNIQAALEAPRFSKITLGGNDVRIEARVPAETRAELEHRGHALDVRADFSGYMGGGQAILRDSGEKVNYGASSPRKDGSAVPEPDPFWGSS
ncbi:MAG TPA: gamma-glutamyltransferase family protein [Bryobacteraceae bacterium]|nr:gamma-glutamyltransferase family protein [Bryobacteraceae bacterium]